MAGIGVKLNKIYQQNTLTTNLVGFGYSTIITIAPMVLVIAAVLIMQVLLEVAKTGYAMRELYSSTVLYIFVFALLTAAPFNSVLSRYISDVIYEETYDDILPCYYVGLIMNIVFSCLFGIPFCLWEFFIGHVSVWYVFAGYCGYAALVMVFYSMLYLSVCKDYKKISFYFLVGMLTTVLCSLLFGKVLHMEVTIAMLISLDIGFLVIAMMEYALIHNYFRENSGKYREVLGYFKKYWPLVITNFFYTLGLYIHNFVFWSTDMHMVVVNTFVSMTVYDMATCLAMFTNISATVIFISRVEMHFHGRYKAYSEAVIGGRGIDISNAERRMFRQLSEELFNLVRIQFIVTIVLYFVCIILLPQFGFGGIIMRIYPCLAVGYFILFIMYSAIIFMYYFNDLKGALMTSIIFVSVTFLVSLIATHLSEVWYGIGVVAGSFAGFACGYHRLRWMEHNLDEHIFCNGNLIKKGKGIQPPGKVFDRYPVKEETDKKKGKKRKSKGKDEDRRRRDRDKDKDRTRRDSRKRDNRERDRKKRDNRERDRARDSRERDRTRDRKRRDNRKRDNRERDKDKKRRDSRKRENKKRNNEKRGRKEE